MKTYYNEIDLRIRESGVLCDSLSLDINSKIKEVRSVGFIGNVSFVVDGELETTLDMSYYMNLRSDPVLSIVDDVKNSVSRENFAGDLIQVTNLSGSFFLNSFSFNIEPNEPISCNANFSSYDDLSGQIEPIIRDTSFDYSIAHGWAMKLNKGSKYYDILRLGYSLESKSEPIYTVGNSKPIAVQRNLIKESFDIVIAEYTGVGYSGGFFHNEILNSDAIEIYDFNIHCESGSQYQADYKRTFTLNDPVINSSSLSIGLDGYAVTNLNIEQFL